MLPYQLVKDDLAEYFALRGPFARYRRDPCGYAKDVLHVEWTEQQMAIARAVVEHPKVFVKASHDVGKCVAADELVTLADGKRVAARDLVGRDFELLTLEFEGSRVMEVGARAEWNSDNEPVFAIVTRSGRRITRNAHHPLWRARGTFAQGTHPKIAVDGWTALSEFAKGDLVAVTSELPAFGDRVMTDAEISFLAYMIGDGGMTAGLRFSQQDNAQLAEFRQCVEGIGCIMRRIPPSPTAKYDYAVIGQLGAGGAQKSAAQLLLARHGLLGKHSRAKFIPEAIFDLPREAVARFLSRLYSTDGWACVSANGCMEIGFCSASERLVRDIQHLLVRFGIRSAIMARTDVKAWSVSIRMATSALRFCDEIGIYGKEEAIERVRASAKQRLESRDRGRWRHREATPGTFWEIVDSVECVGSSATVAIEVPDHHTFLTEFWEHNTFIAGGLVSWHHDSYIPSITKTTAPTRNQVVDLTWKEVRVQRRGRGMLPKAPRIESRLPSGEINMAHYAAGYTARDANAFQGDHEANLLIIFEEATGIDAQFWQAAEGMLSSGHGNRWLAILNPTDTSSEAYQQEMTGDWHVITISALDHPNLMAELRGRPKPFPKAISLSWVEKRLRKWCTEIQARDAKPTDVCWPPVTFCAEKGIEPRWYRPGPLFEGRVLGRWPSQATDAVWSEAAWNAAATRKPDLWQEAESYRIQIGCDRARFGDDWTAIHVRRGPVSVHHESHNGWDTTRTLGRLKELAAEWGYVSGEEPTEVFVAVDDFQGGVVDPAQADGWNFEFINSAELAIEQEAYPNRRSELWFSVAERAGEGRLDLSALSEDVLADLRRQCMSPKWKQDSKGRRVVEPKSETKRRIKRSPDDADAMNLAYAPSGGGGTWAYAGGERTAYA